MTKLGLKVPKSTALFLFQAVVTLLEGWKLGLPFRLNRLFMDFSNNNYANITRDKD